MLIFVRTSSARPTHSRWGMMTSLQPASMAAWSFGSTPPMASTLPMIVISPVMAISLCTGLPVNAETIPFTNVMPANGPSFHGRKDYDVEAHSSSDVRKPASVILSGHPSGTGVPRR